MPNLEYVFVKALATWQRENHPTCSTSSTPSSRDTTTYVNMFDDMLTFEEPLGKIDTVEMQTGKTELVRKQPQHINYLYRGPKLAKYSPLEYALCVEVTAKPQWKDEEVEDKEKTKSGPTPRVSIEFDPDHPTAYAHIQRLRKPSTKFPFPVPIVVARPPAAPKHDDLNTDSEQHRRFAEFYGFLMWPWSTEKGDEFGRAMVSTWYELVQGVNEWRRDDPTRSNRARYWYLNSLASNSRVNSMTRKMLNVRRFEYAREVKCTRRSSKGKERGQDHDEDAQQIVARLNAREAQKGKRRASKREADLVRLEATFDGLYDSTTPKPKRRRRRKATSGAPWKKYTHEWALNENERRKKKQNDLDKMLLMPLEQRLTLIGRSCTPAARLATILDVVADRETGSRRKYFVAPRGATTWYCRVKKTVVKARELKGRQVDVFNHVMNKTNANEQVLLLIHGKWGTTRSTRVRFQLTRVDCAAPGRRGRRTPSSMVSSASRSFRSARPRRAWQPQTTSAAKQHTHFLV